MVMCCILGIILPSFLGIIVRHCKDPYEPIRISWNVIRDKGFKRVAHAKFHVRDSRGSNLMNIDIRLEDETCKLPWRFDMSYLYIYILYIYIYIYNILPNHVKPNIIIGLSYRSYTHPTNHVLHFFYISCQGGIKKNI